MPTKKKPFNKRVHYPLYTKQSKNQLPQNTCFCSMKKNVITRFFFFFAHVAFVGNPPTPPKLIQGQNPAPGCLLSKEANLHWDPRMPNNVMRERLHSPIHQGVLNLTEKFPLFDPTHTIVSLEPNLMEWS